MTDRNEAYDAFVHTFNPTENGGSYPAKTKAIREGVSLVRALVDEPSEQPPEVRAAEIQAVGAMVGKYILAFGENEVTVKSGYPAFKIRHEGLPVRGYPRELALKFKGPDLKVREKLGKLATRFDPRKK